MLGRIQKGLIRMMGGPSGKSIGVNFFDRVLMCPPVHFSVDYKINEWMGGVVEREKAHKQYEDLKKAVQSCGVEVKEVPQKPGLPDMVFCCNSGIAYMNKVYLSHFRHPERQGEREEYLRWFRDNGVEVVGEEERVFFEGGGDAVFSAPDKLWAGYGFRSEKQVYEKIANMGDFHTVLCHLVNPKFYHMDVCFMPLGRDLGLWFPAAFSEETQERMQREAELIEVSEEEAARFACNGITIGNTVILPTHCPNTKQRLEKGGFRVLESDMSEFLKAGGAVQCLIMKL